MSDDKELALRRYEKAIKETIGAYIAVCKLEGQTETTPSEIVGNIAIMAYSVIREGDE